jgi:NDP-sugar pyrophosphorylase family protein
MVSRGTFREDLFYRLNVVALRVPALRERTEDIPLLIAHILARLAGRDGRTKTLSPRVRAALLAHPWPGNVRELENELERLWVLAGDVFAPGFSFDPQAVKVFAASGMLAHLWLVSNPAHNAKGDFGLASLTNSTVPALATNPSPERPGPSYTYSTIGLYRASLFAMPWCPIAAGNPSGLKAPLAPLLRAAIAQGRVSASLYTGLWADVGTPERLAELHSFPDTDMNHV